MSEPQLPPPSDPGYRSWFGFWAQFVVLGALAVWGAFFASHGDTDDYVCGLLLSLGSVAVAFLRLKAWFDGRGTGWTAFLFVDTMEQLVVVIPLFAVIGLIGLFIASGAGGALQNAGVGLFIASGLVVFLSMKRVFDKRDADR